MTSLVPSARPDAAPGGSAGGAFFLGLDVDKATRQLHESYAITCPLSSVNGLART